MSSRKENRQRIFEQALEYYRMLPDWKCFSEKQLIILAEQVADSPSVIPYGFGGFCETDDDAVEDGGIFGSEDKGFDKAFDSFIAGEEYFIAGETF